MRQRCPGVGQMRHVAGVPWALPRAALFAESSADASAASAAVLRHWRGTYQPKASLCGRATGSPFSVACSTAKVKRAPSSNHCGRPITLPSTSTSRPSRAGASCCRAKCAARQPVEPKPSSNIARHKHHARLLRRSHTPHSSTATPHAATYTACCHKAGCANCSATPAIAASEASVTGG